jgi:fumarate reductase flavoprotein subunit
MKPEIIDNPFAIKWDVAVIGAGGGGLAAAVSAAENGARVVVIEKERQAGGATPFAEGLVAAESPTQKRLNNTITREQLFVQHMEYTHWTLNPRLVRALIDLSGDTIGWLEDKGLTFTLRDMHRPRSSDNKEILPASGPPPTFHVPPNWGMGLIKTLLKSCDELGVRIIYKTRAEKLNTNKQGAVTGVRVKSGNAEQTLNSRNVIIASGGYSSSKKLMRKFCPQYDVSNIDKLSVKGTHAGDRLRWVGKMHTGDGILMAFEVGAASDGLGVLLGSGPCFVAGNHGFILGMSPGALRLNSEGERYATEALGPFVSDNATLRQPGQTIYTVFDEAFKQNIIKKGFGAISGGKYRHEASGIEGDLEAAIAQGNCLKTDAWADIAKWIGAKPQTLESTIKEYNGFCDKGHDDLFAKDAALLNPVRTPPYYACRCYPGFLVTIGGIKINHRMEVVKPDNSVIEGLYAAGITTGGWSGNPYNIALPGTGCGFPVYMGRIAGKNAVARIKK